MTLHATSWLETASENERAEQSSFSETVSLLKHVRDHDFEALAGLCDDDFGIVDLDQGGGSVTVRTRAEWEAWFRHLFSELTAARADTDSTITNYQVLAGSDMAMSVVEFTQSLTVSALDATGLFDCVATIVWRQTERGWKEARWHVSLLYIPPELAAA